MKKIFLSLLVVFFTLNMTSQTIFPYSVNSCGSLDFLVGTIVVSNDAGTQAIITEGYTAIFDTQVTDNWLVYPNPSSDFINIVSKRNLQSCIFDITGKQVMINQSNKINISILEKGIYFLKVENSIVKLIKN